MLDLFRALSSSEFYFKMCLALKIAHHIDISPFVSNQLCFAPTRINHALLYSITETQPCLLLIWLLDDIVIIHVRTDNACTRHFRRHDHLLETLSFYPVSPKQKKELFIHHMINNNVALLAVKIYYCWCRRPACSLLKLSIWLLAPSPS